MASRPLERPYRALRTFSTRLALAAGWALLLLSLAIAVEVVSRRLLRLSLQGVDEYGGYLLAICGTIGFSYALFERTHIRIDVLLRALPLPLRAVADVMALLALNFYVWNLLRRSIAVAWQSHEFGAIAVSPLETPLVAPQGIWAAAMGLFAVSALVLVARALLALPARDWGASAREFGVPGAEEEVAQEIEALRHRQQGSSP
ncbi:MAG: TRAP transporter small permease subunit [Proteobacteria bacterium]|nr:TRAP transporter small permease subunit [Pseudomonadota bacterium]